MTDCHCGRETPQGHLCHWERYTCPLEGTRRFYGVRPRIGLGVGLKTTTWDTWACDGHWRVFLGMYLSVEERT